MTSKMFTIGKIVNTHGVKGEVKVLRISDFDDRFAIGNTVFAAMADQKLTKLTIDGHRIHKGFDLVRFKGYDNINDVEQFKGSSLQITEEQLTALDAGEFYYHEIIGCTVYLNTGEKLGEIKEILAPGANDVWVVKQESGKDALIPYIEDVVKEVNVTAKKVIIEPMEGLLN